MMGETNHTKGPWRVNPHVACEVVCDHRWIASTNASAVLDGGKISEANAQLIAAAPELYEALESVLSARVVVECQYRYMEVSIAGLLGNSGNEINWNKLKRARQALKKARGE